MQFEEFTTGHDSHYLLTRVYLLTNSPFVLLRNLDLSMPSLICSFSWRTQQSANDWVTSKNIWPPSLIQRQWSLPTLIICTQTGAFLLWTNCNKWRTSSFPPNGIQPPTKDVFIMHHVIDPGSHLRCYVGTVVSFCALHWANLHQRTTGVNTALDWRHT